MQVGMTLPVIEPGFNREILRQWAEFIDRGPFSSLAAGERMAFPNPELMTALAACAAWTERVRLATTVIVAQLHNPLMLAKQLATIDVISNGRLTVGLGVGGRLDDYRAVGAEFSLRTQAELGRRADLLRRVWAGEKVIDELLRPVEPAPVQSGGPILLAGAQGPKSIRAAAQWADGITGFSFGADPDDIAQTAALARQAWQDAGKPAPKLVFGFWYRFGPNARDQMATHLRRYFNWLPGDEVEAMLPKVGFTGSEAEFRELLNRLEALGIDEVLPIPTSWELDQVERVAALIGPVIDERR